MVTQARLDELRITERVLAGLAGEIAEVPQPAEVEAEPEIPAAPLPSLASTESQGPAPASVVKPPRCFGWTDEEEDVLRKHWPNGGGAAACAPHLPNRSTSAINQHAYVMRLHLIGTALGPIDHLSVDVKVNEQPRAEKKPRTFEEQLEAVRNGATLVDVHPIRRADPDCTLGGVTGEIN